MGNYVIGVGNYVIVSPSELGNYKIVDTETEVETSVHELRERRFRAKPGQPCKRCDLRTLCRWG
jgi:MoaA/NifB/PqqE/SkfB family radical SAM enzyme